MTREGKRVQRTVNQCRVKTVFPILERGGEATLFVVCPETFSPSFNVYRPFTGQWRGTQDRVERGIEACRLLLSVRGERRDTKWARKSASRRMMTGSRPRMLKSKLDNRRYESSRLRSGRRVQYAIAKGGGRCRWPSVLGGRVGQLADLNPFGSWSSLFG